MLPASSEFQENISNVIESHVLERNKYKNLLPIVDSYQFYKTPTLAEPTAISAAGELDGIKLDSLSLDNYALSPRRTNRGSDYWKKRAERTDKDITSGDSAIDIQRETIRKVAASNPFRSSSLGRPKLNTIDGTRYDYNVFGNRNYSKVNNIAITSDRTEDKSSNLKGGINFSATKQSDYALTSVRPAGPVNKKIMSLYL